jgi:hypothetical protein
VASAGGVAEGGVGGVVAFATDSGEDAGAVGDCATGAEGDGEGGVAAGCEGGVAAGVCAAGVAPPAAVWATATDTPTASPAIAKAKVARRGKAVVNISMAPSKRDAAPRHNQNPLSGQSQTSGSTAWRFDARANTAGRLNYKARFARRATKTFAPGASEPPQP